VKILSIDDDKVYQDALVKLITKLSEGKVTIWTAFTLKEGLEKAQTNRPAVVLLDLLLPDTKDFHETIREGVPAFVKMHIPVIVVTCLDLYSHDPDFDIPIESYLAGARRVYPKPMLTKMIPWLGEKPGESWAARLLGDAGTIHLRDNILK
jgi:DNA-binding NarL/FixJ family response regulator